MPLTRAGENRHVRGRAKGRAGSIPTGEGLLNNSPFQGVEGTPLSTGKATPLSPLVRGVKAMPPTRGWKKSPPDKGGWGVTPSTKAFSTAPGKGGIAAFGARQGP